MSFSNKKQTNFSMSLSWQGRQKMIPTYKSLGQPEAHTTCQKICRSLNHPLRPMIDQARTLHYWTAHAHKDWMTFLWFSVSVKLISIKAFQRKMKAKEKKEKEQVHVLAHFFLSPRELGNNFVKSLTTRVRLQTHVIAKNHKSITCNIALDREAPSASYSTLQNLITPRKWKLFAKWGTSNSNQLEKH